MRIINWQNELQHTVHCPWVLQLSLLLGKDHLNGPSNEACSEAVDDIVISETTSCSWAPLFGRGPVYKEYVRKKHWDYNRMKRGRKVEAVKEEEYELGWSQFAKECPRFSAGISTSPETSQPWANQNVWSPYYLDLTKVSFGFPRKLKAFIN